MIKLKFTGTREQIITQLVRLDPKIVGKHQAASDSIEHYNKREVRDYEAMLLYMLAAQYDKPGARILELGTAWGYSAAVMSCAAPNAEIITMTPNPNHVKIARGNLDIYPKVRVFEMTSQDYLAGYNGDKFDLIFVDGDHKRIVEDLPWWDYIKTGGLFFHHDYSPRTSSRPCPPVYRGLQLFATEIGRKADILLSDETGVAVAGWYRKKGDVPWDS